MYEEFDNQSQELQLLYAKDALFRMIDQFHHATDIHDNGELYIYNYCESALEAAFNVLGIEEDYVPLWDFCKMWEDNNRAIWYVHNPNEEYRGITAETYYECFEDAYELWQKHLEEDLNGDN